MDVIIHGLSLDIPLWNIKPPRLVKEMKYTIKKDPHQDERVQEIIEISGQNIFSCYQCGRCSSGCPMAEFMDVLPNQVFMFLQEGDVDTLLKAKTPWICAACFTCTVRCPVGLDLAAVMEAIRELQLRKNYDYVDPYKVDERDILPPIALVSNFRKFTP